MAGLAAPGLKPRTPVGSAYPTAGASAPGGLNAGGYGSAPPAPASTTPPNPSTMGTYGGQTQQTDQMGRVITSTPGSTNMFGAPTQGAPASINIEDPYQNRLSQDFAAYQNKALFDQSLANKTASEAGGGGGGAGGGGGGGGGLDESAILGLLEKLKPEAPPPREAAPAPLQRIEAPGAVASPSAKSQGFARAKDNAGRIANSALKSLRSQMVERGIEGSGVEGALTGNVLGETARGVADASFQQEREAEKQQWEAAQLGYQGAINQRGQDYGIMGTGFSGNVNQRGQDISAQPNMLSLFPTIAGLMKRY